MGVGTKKEKININIELNQYLSGLCQQHGSLKDRDLPLKII
jgi:hypothetical protein